MTQAKQKSTFERILREVHAMEKRATVQGWAVIKDGKLAVTVKMAYLKSGTVKALAFDHTAKVPDTREARQYHTRWQVGVATGYGYSKSDAAMEGMTLAGYTITEAGDSWQRQLTSAGFEVYQIV